MGLQHDIFARAKKAGVDGVLIVDCPLEEAKIYEAPCLQQGLAPIYVVTPATPIERIAKIDKHGKGFLYYACRKGTTGVKAGLPEGFAEKIQEIKTVAHLPIAVGFGISQAEMVQQILQEADAFVVGSLFVKALADGYSYAQLTELAQSLTQ